ncbi:MAG: hypothetical protein R3F62_10260 [Planctomycetota bacterium]
MPALLRLLVVTLFLAFLAAGQGVGMLTPAAEGDVSAEEVVGSDALVREAPRKETRRRQPLDPASTPRVPAAASAQRGLQPLARPAGVSVGWSRPPRC